VITIFNKEIKNSLKQLRVKLIFPDILFFIVSLFLLGLFTRVTGLINLSPEIVESELEQFVIANLGSLVSSLIIFVLVAFFVGAGLKAFKLNMILESMKGKDFKLWDAFKGSHKFYWRVVGLKILSFVVLLIGFVLAIIVYSLLRNILEYLAAILAVLIMLYIVLALLLKEAALFQKNSNSLDAIKSSFKTFTKNKMLILALLVIILIVNFVAAILNEIFTLNPGFLGTVISTFFLMIILLISAWGNLLTFNVYKNLSKKPVRVVKKAVKKSKKKAVKKSTKKTTKKTRKRKSK
jgi:hypothetical protein